MIKLYSDISKNMSDYISSKYREVDVSEGTPVNDIIINAPALEIADLYEELNTTQRAQSVATAEESGAEIMIENMGSTRILNRYAKGTVTFFSYNAPTGDVKIPAGVIVSTTSTSSVSGKRFRTVNQVIMYSTLSSMYYNTATGLYEIDAEIEAVEPGLSYVVGANTITALFTVVAGVSGCYNTYATYGGQDKETLEKLKARIASMNRGVVIGTTDGILAEILSNSAVEDAVVVGGHDSYRELFGAIDVYVKGKEVGTNTDVYNLYNGVSTTKFNKQPVLVDGITSVTGDYSGIISSDLYDVVKDFEEYGGSVEALDVIQWAPSVGVNNVVVSVVYNYNSLIESLQKIFDKSNKDIQNTDILVKWAVEIPIDYTFDIKILQGYDETVVKANVSDAIALFHNGLGIGDEVQQADAAEAILAVEGLDDMKLPFTLFRGINGSETIVPNDFGNLTIPQYAYAVSGTIIINATFSSRR